jgi:hypothetical protein
LYRAATSCARVAAATLSATAAADQRHEALAAAGCTTCAPARAITYAAYAASCSEAAASSAATA